MDRRDGQTRLLSRLGIARGLGIRQLSSRLGLEAVHPREARHQIVRALPNRILLAILSKHEPLNALHAEGIDEPAHEFRQAALAAFPTERALLFRRASQLPRVHFQPKSLRIGTPRWASRHTLSATAAGNGHSGIIIHVASRLDLRLWAGEGTFTRSLFA